MNQFSTKMTVLIATTIESGGVVYGKRNEIFQYVCNFPNINMWFGIMRDRIVGPVVFADKAITDVMFEFYVFPQIGDS